jgi:hypothetical protein
VRIVTIANSFPAASACGWHVRMTTHLRLG